MRKTLVLLLSISSIFLNQTESFAENATASNPLIVVSKGPYKLGDVVTFSIFLKTKFKIVGEPTIEGFSSALEAKGKGYFSHLNSYYGPIQYGAVAPTYDPDFYSYSFVEKSADSFEYTLRISKPVLYRATTAESEMQIITISYRDEARQTFKRELYLANFGISKQIFSGERYVAPGFIWKQKDEVLPTYPSEHDIDASKGLTLPRMTINGTPINYSLLTTGSTCSLSGFRFPGDNASQLNFTQAGFPCSFNAFTLEDDTYKAAEKRVTITPVSSEYAASRQKDILKEKERVEQEKILQNRETQSIVVSPSTIGSVPYNLKALPLNVSATSNLPVSVYNNTSYSCEYKNNSVVIKESGRCVIAFDQAGNNEFRPAKTVILEFVIESAPKKTITCIKGKTTKKVSAVKPSCPAGYKKK